MICPVDPTWRSFGSWPSLSIFEPRKIYRETTIVLLYIFQISDIDLDGLLSLLLLENAKSRLAGGTLAIFFGSEQ